MEHLEKKEESLEEQDGVQQKDKPMERSKIFLVICGVLFVVTIGAGAIVYPMIAEFKQAADSTNDSLKLEEEESLVNVHPINVYTLDRSEEDMMYIKGLSDEEFGTLAGQIFQGLLNGNSEGDEKNQLFLFEFALTLDYRLWGEVSDEERGALLGAYLSALQERDEIDVPEEATEEERQYLYADMVETFSQAVRDILGDEERAARVLE